MFCLFAFYYITPDLNFFFSLSLAAPVTCRYRVLRYSAVINTLESLSIQAMMQRSKTCVQENSENQDECFITCELENLSPVS